MSANKEGSKQEKFWSSFFKSLWGKGEAQKKKKSTASEAVLCGEVEPSCGGMFCPFSHLGVPASPPLQTKSSILPASRPFSRHSSTASPKGDALGMPMECQGGHLPFTVPFRENYFFLGYGFSSSVRLRM